MPSVLADSGTGKLVPATAASCIPVPVPVVVVVPFRSVVAAVAVAAGDAVVEVFGVLLMLHVELLLDPELEPVAVAVACMLEIGTTGVAAGLVNMFMLSGLATLVVVEGLCRLDRPLRQPGLDRD